MTEHQYIENKTYEEIQIGDSACVQRTLTFDDIKMFAALSGDYNPAVLDEKFAQEGIFHHVVGHGMWGGALISSVLGTQLPGPGTIYLGQTLKFTHPVHVGDTLCVTCTVIKKDDEHKHLTFDCLCKNQKEEVVIRGEAFVLAPTEKKRTLRPDLVELQMRPSHAGFSEIFEKAEKFDPITMAVAHPCDKESFMGAIDAAREGLIVPILVGPRARLETLAQENVVDLSEYEVIDAEHSHASAALAVELVKSGRAKALMKGSLHTDELMSEVISSKTGIRTERRISHVFVMDVPSYPHTLLITDAAINIEPDLDAKQHIVQNAIDLAQALGKQTPKVAILAAVETVNTRMRSTIEAAALCKMADRKQITGAVLDGPLAFDNAISAVAAKTKGIVSPVAGDPDILLVPDLESGNMLAKQLSYLANAEAAGIVLGARVPIVLTSRADNAMTRKTSCAIALLYAHRGTPKA